MSFPDMKERFKMLGIFMVCFFIGIPLMGIVYLGNIAAWILAVLDLPIWLLSGKTPFISFAKWTDKMTVEL